MRQEEEKAHAEDNRRQAIAFKLGHKTKDAPQVTARCTQLGNVYGVGIGLYFQTIAWLRLLLFWLALAAVPFMVVINTSQFTTADYKGVLDGPGVAVLSSFNPLQSWTFAAIMDDSRDSGILAWMNIQLPGFEGVFSMSRTVFLEWISIIDAGSMAVLSVTCMLLYKMAARFVKAVDDATMEVADYTVVVKGLPTEITPQEIGHHFKRFGKVMDVVMVKDFGPLLSLTAQATALKEKHDHAKERSERGHNAAAYQRQVEAAEQKLAKFYDEANKQLNHGLQLKAVFVTFNSQVERATCQARCPRRWISSLFQHHSERFGESKHRFWVEQAKPPEDYIYENLHYSRLSRYIRSVVVILMVLAILLVSAAAVTKLMAINISSSRNIVWSQADMTSRIDAAMLTQPLNATQEPDAPGAANTTLATIVSVAGEAAAVTLTGPVAMGRLGYCSLMLQQTCSEKLGSILKTQVTMQPAEKVQWANLADSLLKAKDMYSQLQVWSGTDSDAAYSMCYPCYCNLLSAVAAAKAVEGDWVYSTRQECSAFVSVDIKVYAMKALVSGVIVVLNMVLKQALQLLVSFEKHWTKSDQERHYAVMAFVSQLMNSVLVLLLVNARSSSASAVINSTLSGNSKTSWGANLILSGAYNDFSPSWYVDVGQSLEIIIILNAVLTVTTAWMFWVYRKLKQSCLLHCVVTASQSMYNKAWVGDDFVLDYRVSDMMLGLWIILMFGSGMPGIYIYGIAWLLVLDVTDRWYLVTMCQHPVRYGKNLPYLLLGVLPWVAATHCAFGVWMHTYFHAGSSQGLSDLASSATSSIASLASSDIGRRLTQINGLPLLVLLIAHLTIHVVTRFMIYFFSGAAFKSCCGDLREAPEIEITYESALLSAYSKKASSNKKLAGTPTYRLPHHPRYQDMFGDNAAYKPLWFKAFGRDRYTQLVSRPGGTFQITSEPVLEHDETEVYKLLEGLGEQAQSVARKLADSDKRSSVAPGALRERSQSVSVTVMAGLWAESPKTPGSFTGSPASASHRHSVMGPVTGLSPGSFMQGHGASFVAAASAGSFTAGLSGVTSVPASSAPSFDSCVQPVVIHPGGVILTSPAPGAGFETHRYSADDGRLLNTLRMSATLQQPMIGSNAIDLPVVHGASPWYLEGAVGVGVVGQCPEISAAPPAGWQQPPAATSEHLLGPANAQVNAYLPIPDGAMPAIMPVHAVVTGCGDAYPQMDFSTAALQGGWAVSQSVDAVLAAAATAGWGVAGMNWTATQQGTFVPLESQVPFPSGGELLWGGALAAAVSASQQMPSVSLTPYASSSIPTTILQPMLQQAGTVAGSAQAMVSFPPARDAETLATVFARGAACPALLYEPVCEPAGYPDQYPNVHLTTVELPAVSTAAPSLSAAPAVSAHRSSPANMSITAADTMEQQVPGAEAGSLLGQLQAIASSTDSAASAEAPLQAPPIEPSSTTACSALAPVQQTGHIAGQYVTSQPEALTLLPQELPAAAAEAAASTIDLSQLQVSQTSEFIAGQLPVDNGMLAEASGAELEHNDANLAGLSIPPPEEQPLLRQSRTQDNDHEVVSDELQLQLAVDHEWAPSQSECDTPDGSCAGLEPPHTSQPSPANQVHSSSGTGGKKRKKHKKGKKKGHKG